MNSTSSSNLVHSQCSASQCPVWAKAGDLPSISSCVVACGSGRPNQTPPVSPARRAIDRATRLRWLAGRRDERQAWDAFESVDGVPLERAILQSPYWRTSESGFAISHANAAHKGQGIGPRGASTGCGYSMQEAPSSSTIPPTMEHAAA